MMKTLLFDLSSKGFIIKFVWVPAHCKIYGNEQADSLAKFGVHRGITYNRHVLPFEYYPKLKDKSLLDWQICWNSSDKGRWCHSICPKVSNYPWFKNISASRNFICSFSRLMSNHYICNSHLYRINIKDSNLCDCGESYEDIDHIVFQCRKFILPRKKLINNIVNLNHPIPISVRDILGTKCYPVLKILFEFLKEISYFV